MTNRTFIKIQIALLAVLLIAGGTFGFFVYSWNNAYSKHEVVTEDGTYNGEFKGTMFHGQGTFKFNTGITYKGEWKDGEMEGYGVLTFSNGSKYEGDFENGLYDGKGKITNGKKVTSGTWENGILVEKDK